MMIKCEIEDFGENDVRAQCTRCGKKVSGFSKLHCLVLMHQSCPGWKYHRYVEDDGIPDPREQYEPRYKGDPTCIFTAEGLALHQRIKAAYDQAIRSSRGRS